MRVAQKRLADPGARTYGILELIIVGWCLTNKTKYISLSNLK